MTAHEEPHPRKPHGFRQWLAGRNGAIAVGISVAAVISTATAGLLLEDVFPPRGGTDWSALTVWRTVILVLAVGALVALLLVRFGGRRARGTLFYIRLLAAGQPDYSILRLDARGFEHERVVAVIDRALGDGGPVLDLRRTVESVVDRVNDELARDDKDTRDHVAPNLIMPAALAVGYSTNLHPDITVHEYNGPRHNTTGPPVAEFSFTIRQVAEASARGDFAGIATTWIEKADVPDTPAPQAVWLDVHLTDKATAMLVAPAVPLTDYIRWRVRAPGPASGVGTAPPQHDSGIGVVVGQTQWGTNGAVSGATLAALVLQVLHDAATAYPGLPIVVTGRMPKSVAFAAGYSLRQPCLAHPADEPCPLPNLWKRLNPVFFDQATNGSTITWVRYDQEVLVVGPPEVGGAT